MLNQSFRTRTSQTLLFLWRPPAFDPVVSGTSLFANDQRETAQRLEGPYLDVKGQRRGGLLVLPKEGEGPKRSITERFGLSVGPVTERFSGGCGPHGCRSALAASAWTRLRAASTNPSTSTAGSRTSARPSARPTANAVSRA